MMMDDLILKLQEGLKAWWRWLSANGGEMEPQAEDAEISRDELILRLTR
jgi:hypothetical protein